MGFWRITTMGPGELIGIAADAFERRVGPEPLSISMFEAGLTNGKMQWTLDILNTDELDMLAVAKALFEFDPKLIDLELYQIPVPDEDWIAKSLEGLKPIHAGPFFVHGSHDAHLVPPGSIPILIEAGEAFGTGHHGTTEGCLEALSQIARDVKPESVLDLGTGSGILAIAAAKQWRVPVLATDIDPIAVRVAHENATLNGVQRHLRTIVAAGTTHAEIHDRAPFDLVVANILARPLRQLAGDIMAVLAPGGLLILSGILSEQAPRVTSVYRGHHAHSQARLTNGEWVTLIFRKT